MRPFVRRGDPAQGLGDLLEKLEILRAGLRWAARTGEADFPKLLAQCGELRDQALAQIKAGRLGGAPDGAPEPLRAPAAAARRRALEERRFAFEGVFGDSPPLLDALEIAARAAPTDLPVLIQGESGTGKELLAKVVHANGGRGERPFVSVNCGAIPENLLESELFGHRKGAFTGAGSDRKGKFESADGGTIFLDEVGELPLPGQVKLLRVLQANEIQRVGSDQLITVDTRVVSATNRDLLAMVRAGGFREDLYYRLGVIQVTLPPLRERRDEIPLLLEYFLGEALDKLGRGPLALTPRLTGFLNDYAYPGNIRELRNLVFRIACLADDTADLRHLPAEVLEAVGPMPADAGEPSPRTLGDARRAAGDLAERQFLQQELRRSGGNVTEVARRVGLNRTHVQGLLKKHGLNSKDFRPSRGGA